MLDCLPLRRKPLTLSILFITLAIVMSITISTSDVFAEETSAPISETPTPFIIGTGEFSYNDGLYDESSFRFPYGVAYSESTNSLIIVDTQNHRIRQMDLATYEITTLAGTSTQVDRFDFPAGGHVDGDADKALFNRPRGIAIAPNGAIFVADTGNHAIRKIYDGKVYTVAGSGLPGHADGQGIQAQFQNPTEIVIDKDGNIYVSDTLNHCIRKIDEQGNVTTYAGNPNNKNLLFEPSGLALDKSNNLYVADTANHQIKKITDGKIEVVAGKPSEIDEDTGYYIGGNVNGTLKDAQFNYPKGLVFLDNGFLIVSDSWNHVIKAISPLGRVFTIVGAGVSGYNWDDEYTIYLDGPTGITQGNGNLYITDYWNNRIVVLPANSEFIKPIIDFSQKKSDVPVYIDGTELDFPDVKPLIIDNHVNIPVRIVAENIDATVMWDENNRKVIVNRNNKNVEFYETTNDFFIYEGRSMVPLRIMSEKLGLDVDWKEEHRAVIIESFKQLK